MDSLEKYCAEHGLLLIDSADYSFGGTFGGRALGSFGDFSILNFQEGKAIPIGGGMALSSRSGVLPSVRPAYWYEGSKSLLRSTAYAVLIRPGPYGLISRLLRCLGVEKKRLSMEDTIRRTENEYDFIAPAATVLTEISGFQAALGLRLLQRLLVEMECRRANAARLERLLADIPGCRRVVRHPRLESLNPIRYPVLIDGGRRDAVWRRLAAAGFEASPMYVEHGMQVDVAQFPGAARVCAELLTLPCHAFMGPADIDRLATELRDSLDLGRYVP